MRSRLKSAPFAVLSALLICVGALALLHLSEPSPVATGSGVSSGRLAPLSGSGLLLQSGQSQQPRLASRTPVCVMVAPVLVAGPTRRAELVREFNPTAGSPSLELRAGRSPPSFS